LYLLEEDDLDDH